MLKHPCAICGVREATTRDHVPPKAVFVEPFPKKLITVPACELCNNGSSGLDAHFRVYLGAVVGDKSADGKKLWKERSLATLHKNRKLVTTISTVMQSVDAFDEAGTRIGKRTRIVWPANVFNPVIERIARGLYYHHFNEILGARAQCTVGFHYTLTDEIMEDTRVLAQSDIGDGAFSYRYGRAELEPLRSVWIFEFYQGQWASVITSPASQSK